jgi:hypothetical protein
MWWLMPAIPGAWEAEIGRIAVWGQPEENINDTLTQPVKLGMVVTICHPSYAEGINQRHVVQADPAIHVKLY